jgi:polyisoprenoid-binding protein YceI
MGDMETNTFGRRLAGDGIVTRPSRLAEPAPAPKKRWRWVALAATTAVLLAGAGLWYFVLRHDAPAAVDLDQALAGIEAPATTVPPASTATTAAAATTAATDGTWRVDPSITNAQGTGSFTGFRIDEVLVSVGSTTAVGRTTTVDGTLTVSGSTVSAAQISADLTDITTNDSRRDDAVQRALSTTRYPNATFVLTQPIQVGSVPADGQRISVPATGDLTIRGVTRQVTIELQAQLQGDVLVVVGSAPVALADFGVTAPTAPVVASVEDQGTFEFQLYFRR